MKNGNYLHQCLLVALIAFISFGENYQFSGTYTPYNSLLLSDSVFCVAIDSSGMKWFGTKKGISTLKGTEWINYTTTTSDLVNNRVLDVTIDEVDNKWFATVGGVSVYNSVTWTNYTSVNSGLINDTVNCIELDASGKKWIGTNAGVSIFDGVSWSNYTTENSDLIDNVINSIAFDADGSVWFATNRGISHLSNGVWKNYGPTNSSIGKEDNDLVVDYLMIDHNGDKWACNDSVVHFFQGTTWKERKTYSRHGITSIGGDHVFYVDSNNRYWAKYARITGSTGDSTGHYESYFNIASGEVFDIAEDENNVLWFCTKWGVKYSDEGVKDVYLNKSVERIDYFIPIGTELGIFYNPNLDNNGELEKILGWETEWNLLSGDEFFELKGKKISGGGFDSTKVYGSPSLLTKKNILSTNDSIRFSVEVKKADLIDTFHYSFPNRKWSTTEETSPYIKVEIPTKLHECLYPDKKDLVVPVHLVPVNNFNSTTTLVATKSSTGKTEINVPQEGYYVELIVPADSLEMGKNSLTISAINSGINLGNAEINVTIGGAFILSDTSSYADSVGDVHAFSIEISEFGKSYFGEELIEVKEYSSDYIIGTGTQSDSYNKYHWAIVDTVTQDTIYRHAFNGDKNNNELFEISLNPLGKYNFVATAKESSTLKNATMKIGDVMFSTKLGTINASVYDLNKEIRLQPEKLLLSIDTISSSDIIEEIMNTKGTHSSKTYEFSGLVSKKNLVSPTIDFKLPFHIDTILTEIPGWGQTFSYGKVDTVRNNFWIFDDDTSGVFFLINNTWISKNVSGVITYSKLAPNGDIWIGTSNGIYCMDIADTSWTHHNNLSGKRVSSIHVDSLNNVFVYTTQWDKYSKPFWTKSVSIDEVPKTSISRAEYIRKGLSQIPYFYGVIGREVVQYKINDEHIISIIESSKICNNYSNKIHIFPNPVSKNEPGVDIILPDSKNGKCDILILDMLGNLIDEHSFSNSNVTNYHWDLQNRFGNKVTTGSYVIFASSIDQHGKKHIFKAIIGVKE